MVEAIVYGVVGACVVGLLLWQRGQQSRLRQARVIEAPIAQRGTIVSALLVALAILFTLFTLMMVSLEEWTRALVLAAISAAVWGAFWFTKKPLGVLRVDTDAATLVFSYRGSTVQLDLRQPFELWCRCIEEAASFLEGTRSERIRQMGRSLVTGFSESFMGRAIAPLARMHGPQRSLERAPTLFRQTNNYMQPKVDLAEPRHVQIRVNEVSPIPDLLAGAIEAVILFTGGKEPKVVFEQGTIDTLYDVRWA